MITVCFTYFRSLTLKNLEAALFSVRQQDLSNVESIVIVDNDTEDSPRDVQSIIDELSFPVTTRLLSFRHGDTTKTHSWSTNVALSEATTPWVLFSRADYLLDFDLLRRFSAVVSSKPANWNGFVVGNVYHLVVDVAKCEQTNWRTRGTHVLRDLPGVEESYTHIDSGVWMAWRAAFNYVGGLDERLSAWGHAQTHFQHKLYEAGTEFVRIPEVLFYHPQHAAPRDLAAAHQQLQEHGIEIKKLWARYEGAKPYGA